MLQGKLKNYLRKPRDLFKIKYISVYFCVIIIPFLFLGLFLFSDFTNMLKKEVLRNDYESLKVISSKIDFEISAMRRMSSIILQDATFSTYYLNSSVTSQIKLSNTLKYYKLANGFVTDIFFYTKYNDYVYSSSGIYNKSASMSNNVFEQLGLTQAEFYNSMKSPIPLIKNCNGNLLFIFPRLNLLNDSQALIYKVDENNFSRIGIDSDSQITIINDTNNEILFSSKDFLNNVRIYSNINSNCETDEIMLNAERHLLSTVVSKDNQLKYYIFSSYSNEIQKVNTQRSKAIILMSICVLFIGVIIYEINKSYYRLIKEIQNHFRTGLRQYKNITQMCNALANVFIEKEKMLTDINKYVNEVKCCFHKELVLGLIKNKNEYEKMCQKIGIDRLYDNFIVLGIVFMDDEGNQSDKITCTILDRINKMQNVFAFQLNIYKSILVINTKDRIFDNIKLVLKKSCESSEKEFIVLLSEYINNVTQLSFEIQYCINSMKSCNNNEETSGIFVLKHENEIYRLNKWDKQNYEIKLENAINTKNIDIIKKTMLNTLNEIEETISFSIIRKYVYFEFLNLTESIFLKYNLNISNTDISNIGMLENVNFCKDKFIKEYLEDVIYNLKGNKYFLSDKNSDIVSSTIQYIQKNYHLHDLNIYDVADNLGYSYKYLSRQFKNLTGYNLSEYISRVRINKFKELIKETDEHVDKLILRIGYKDKSIFDRRFKQIEGISISQYLRIAER